MDRFRDRSDAGEQLGTMLVARKFAHPLVLALPRGGVPVGFEIAKKLSCPLDTIVSRKIGAPFNPEFAVGAIAPYDVIFLDEDYSTLSDSSRTAIDGVIEKERDEMRRLIGKYGSGSYSADYIPQTVVVVDDGVATGMTARAALKSARICYPNARIVFASPVCIGDATEKLAKEADEIICLSSPPDFYAIGQAYEHFDQVLDEEVIRLLQKANA